MGPVVENLAAEYGHDVAFLKIDIDEQERLASRFQIKVRVVLTGSVLPVSATRGSQAVPTCLFFLKGERLPGAVVGMDEESLRAAVIALASGGGDHESDAETER
jgi:hypothetical protein